VTQFPSTTNRPVLEVKRLSVAARCQNVSFSVDAGEIFVLTGMVGSGRSTVGRAIFGAIAPDAGVIRVAERFGPFNSPMAGKAAGVAYVPEDRKRQGLLPQRAIRENITLAHREEAASLGFIRL